jgi:hypothetical protein
MSLTITVEKSALLPFRIKDESGTESEAQITIFEDTWHWNLSAEQTYTELLTEAPDHVARMIESLRDFIGTKQMMAYLVMMAARLIELHRVLKPTGAYAIVQDTHPTSKSYYSTVTILFLIISIIFSNASKCTIVI